MTTSPRTEYKFLWERFAYFFEKFPWVTDRDVSKFPESEITESTMYNIRKKTCKTMRKSTYEKCVAFLALYESASPQKIHEITTRIREEEKGNGFQQKIKDTKYSSHIPITQENRSDDIYDLLVHLGQEIKLLRQDVHSFRMQMSLAKYKPYVDAVKAQNVTPPFTPTKLQDEAQQPTVTRKRGWFFR